MVAAQRKHMRRRSFYRAGHTGHAIAAKALIGGRAEANQIVGIATGAAAAHNAGSVLRTSLAAPAAVFRVGLGIDAGAIAGDVARFATRLAGAVAAESAGRTAVAAAAAVVRILFQIGAAPITIHLAARTAAFAFSVVAYLALFAGMAAGAAVGRRRFEVDAQFAAKRFFVAAAKGTAALAADLICGTGGLTVTAMVWVLQQVHAVLSAGGKSAATGGDTCSALAYRTGGTCVETPTAVLTAGIDVNAGTTAVGQAR